MSAAIDEQLLDLIACPETREKLTLAEQAMVDRVNAAIGAGKLKNRAGRTLTDALEAGLLRPDNKYMYPVQGGFPSLLIDEAIPLAQLD